MKLAAYRPKAVSPRAHQHQAADEARVVQRQTWGAIGIVLGLFAVLRFLLGPLPQDPAYHFFADARAWGPIPRAGDVLTNVAILVAGLGGVAFSRRVRIAAGERPAYALLVFAMLATSVGSAWYHAAPTDARLVWDRLPMTLLLAALLALVLSDRVHHAFARAAWWPFALCGVASVAWWAWTDRDGSGGDLLFYVVVRAGAGLAIVYLLLFRPGRYTRGGWLAAAIVLDVAMTVCELLDHPIFAATRGLISGHSVKHLLAGALLGCILAWLMLRERRSGE